MDARVSRVEPDARVGADSFNLGRGPASVNGSGPTFTPAAANRVGVAARARLRDLGITMTDVQVEPGRAGVKGDARPGLIRLFRTDAGWRHTLDHEAIHILRERGLIRPDEWKALVRAARGKPDLMAAVDEAYVDLPTIGRMEEAVAELFADWRQDREGEGLLQSAFERIRSVFRALASALRGEGFIDGAMVMERIASGEVGGRGPDGPGTGQPRDGQGRFTTAEQRDTGPFGPVLHGYEGRWREAALELERLQSGEAPGALYHPEVGPIALVWGKEGTGRSDGMGLAKLVAWHPEVMDDLQARLAGMRVTERSENRIQMRGNGNKGAVRLDYDGRAGAWLLSIFEEGVPRRTERSTDSLRDLWGNLAPSPRRGNLNVDGAGDSVKEQRDLSAIRASFTGAARRARGTIGNAHWKNTPDFFSGLLTDAMGRNSQMNVLALVPGRALFSELGKGLKAAQSYLHKKEAMDAERNEWHGRGDRVAREWWKLRRKDSEANERLMDLMHKATLAGVDPADSEGWQHPQAAAAEVARDRQDSASQAFAARVEAEEAQRLAAWTKLRAEYDALPADFQAMFSTVRDEYTTLADAMDQALIDNIKKAVAVATKQAARAHRKELARIRDEGLKGLEREEAIADADAKLTRAQARAALMSRAPAASMRAQFESNRMAGPYFPLARFGRYFVTIRDDEGAVVSFSRFETKAQQDAFVRQAESDGLGKVERGMLGETTLKDQVDPRFVAQVEGMMADAGADEGLMDAIWQRWLETLPDQSVRKSQIHRKGRAGFNTDAFRAFGKQMFHGAHQLARLKHGLEMAELLNDAEEEAARAAKPERAGFVVEEMRRRHEFTMNPKGGAVASAATSLGFVWYLGMSPAAALVNTTQTTLIGVPIMSHRFKKAGVTGSIAALSRAAGDFGRGWGWAENSARLSDDERAAMREAYRLGTVDKTQAHDLASVAESGVEYSPVRQVVMEKIGAMFHHAERLNREVTFLANYRLLREDGADHAAAVREASDLTWKVHFDYQNSSRPRFMQGDIPKVIFLFRSFTVNSLWRLFRDAHQTFRGATAEERAEAKAQLIGITLSMMAHAGIRGTWGYGLLMMLLGMFFAGGDDGAEEWLEDALLMEGDDTGTAAWNWIMGMALNGAPGHLTGIDLSQRIGSPNLWFRDSGRDLEGMDWWNALLADLLGPVIGLGASAVRGVEIAERDGWRGIETAAPKFIRDGMQAYRFATDGATTLNGDPLIENMDPRSVLVRLVGFTPAELSERYRVNNRLKNEEKRIMDRRSDLLRAATGPLRDGKPIPPKAVAAIRAFNREFPEYPITTDTIRRSFKGRQRASQRNEFGVQLNPKLNNRLRRDRPPMVYN